MRESLVTVAATWVLAYRERHGKGTLRDITEAALTRMDDSLRTFHAAFMAGPATVMKSAANTPKMHQLAHATSAMRRMGALRNYSSNFYEKAHVAHKAAYRASSKRRSTAHAEVTRRLRVSRIVRSTRRDTEPSSTYNTCFLRAALSAQHEFQASSTKMYWQDWAGAAGGVSVDRVATTARRTAARLQSQADLARLPAALNKYLSDASITAPSTIRVVDSAVLASTVPWVPDETVLHPVRAAPMMWKQSWFSDVSVRSPVAGDVWYGQLRLMFWAEGRKLAFVRWYQIVDKEDVLTEHGCVALEWETVDVHGPRGGSRVKVPRYQVILMSDIKARQYIVPDFSKPRDKGFHVSAFKWDRLPADKSGFAPETYH